VLILSAYPRVLDSPGNYGKDAFISKPFELNELVEKVALFASTTPSALLLFD
jgi:hypothetical protein